MSIRVGTGRGARGGLLFRDAEALETFEAIDTLVVDKTGTLTEGKPVVVAVETVGGLAEDELLALAAGLERGSEHPLAAAIVAAARDRGLGVGEARSEEHTSEVQSLMRISYAVFCLKNNREKRITSE